MLMGAGTKLNMGKTAKEIKEAVGVSTEKVEVLADTLDQIHELKVMLKSDAGKSLVNILVANCDAALRGIYSETDLTKIVPFLAAYRANIDLLAELQGITAEEEIARQLDEAVKEALQTEAVHTP
jgi:flagellin-specific chaperone FliS